MRLRGRVSGPMSGGGVVRVGRSWAALAVALTLATASLSACEGAAKGSDAGEDPAEVSASTASDGEASPASPSPSSSGKASISPDAVDPRHAVPPPGPRKGPLVPADLLVVSQKTISDDVIKKVRATRGVSGVESISLAQVSVEDRLLNLVAADPGSYRHFTPVQSADNQAVWDRVAGGELAVAQSKKAALPPDDKGFVRLGAAKDVPELHIGAYAPQIDGAVDLVVNQKWGKALGMVPGNALLISTTITAPDRVVKPLGELLGKKVSVQRLDVVARTGIDPGAVQTAVVVGSVADAVGHYTYSVLGGGRIAPDPAWVSTHITTDVVPILGKVTCNKLIFPQLKAALQEVVQRGLADKIHPGEYAGCYYPRFIAGSTSLSNHAFGLALDFNVPGNGRGTVGQMDRAVVAIFESWGFTWGGRWKYTDPMHFEMNRIVRPG